METDEERATRKKKYLAECRKIVRDTLGGLMENASADDRWDLLLAVRTYVQELLDELAED